MSASHHRPAAPLEGVLPPAVHAHPPPRTAGDLLARDAPDALVPRAREAPRHMLGHHRHHDQRVACDPALGDEQSLVGDGGEGRAPGVEEEDRRAVGRAPVGLGRGMGAVRRPDGGVLFRDGVGGGAEEGLAGLLSASSFVFLDPVCFVSSLDFEATRAATYLCS